MDEELTRLPGGGEPVSDGIRTETRPLRFEPGTLFAGRFRIVALLGRGGMGEVYRADDLKLGQTVALSRPYAAASMWVIAAAVALASFGFYASRGGQPLFGRALLD